MDFNEPTFVYDLANNHMGSVDHALNIIESLAKETTQNSLFSEFSHVFKFQYRDLSTLIHPKYQDSKDVPYIIRFKSTEMSLDNLFTLMNRAKELGFITACTPFDEVSVDNVLKHNFDVIKIASCSCLDWGILEKVATAGKPVIVSTAGVELTDLDRVVEFFKNRGTNFALLHCVAVYPTQLSDMNLNRIDLFKNRYPGISVGLSSHEIPGSLDSVKIAIGKGATIFERHVGMTGIECPSLNKYSSTPAYISLWLSEAKRALSCCNIKTNSDSTEKITLNSLKRAVFVNKDIQKGAIIGENDIFLAIPGVDGQVLADNLSKYTKIHALDDIKKDGPLMKNQVRMEDLSVQITGVVRNAVKLLKKAGIVIPSDTILEISHHYGLDRFDQCGSVMFTLINTPNYCKKIIVMFPDQKHPGQYHKEKEETFFILYGHVTVAVNSLMAHLARGKVLTIKPGEVHQLYTKSGVVIEEVSSVHKSSDSFYVDDEINRNKNRKTLVKYWSKK